ncbi:MAG: hypothetical protein C5B54_10795, partial [Acidobacteria bacterium]
MHKKKCQNPKSEIRKKFKIRNLNFKFELFEFASDFVLRISDFKWLFLCLIVIWCSGCAVGPKYKRPEVTVPTQYKEDDVWKNAQPTDAISRGKWWEVFHDPELNSLEEQISVSNQNLKSSEAQYREALAIVRQNRADYFPTITTSPSVTVSQASRNRAIVVGTGSNNTGTGTISGTTQNTTYSLPFDFSYEADVWGRVRKSVEAATENAQASAADLESVRLSLQAELATDYFELRSLDAQEDVLNSTVTDYEKALRLTQLRHDSGIASGIDVAQAQTQLETTRAQAIDLRVNRAQLEHAIAVLVGQAASAFSLNARPMENSVPIAPPSLPSALLQRRPDIAAAERRVAAANAQIGVTQTAFFPAIMLSATGGFQSSSIANWLTWPSRFWSLGPTVIQTIFDGGKRRAISDQAWAAYDSTVADYRQNVLTAFQEVEDNLAALSILADEANVQNAAVKAASNAVRISNNRYQGGIGTYLEVLVAQNVLLTNQRVEIDIMQRRLSASVLLIKALGGGWGAA